MNKYIKFLLLILTAIELNGCQLGWKQPIPENEIIYQMEETQYVYRLGFIDSTGKNSDVVEISRQFAKPVWSKNGKILFGLSSAAAPSDAGYPAYWDITQGHFKNCSANLHYMVQIQSAENPENPYEAIISDGRTLYLYDISQCLIEQTLIDYSSGADSIAGFSYSDTKNEIVYGLVTDPYTDRGYQLLLYDIQTNKITQLAEGINPAWSPDGTKIAYIGEEGLYVLDISKNNPLAQKNLGQLSIHIKRAGSSWEFVTIPSWSPDNEWLVYHRCKNNDLCSWDDSQICKININNAIVVELTNGGKYPNWKP